MFDESHKAKNLVPEAGSKPTKVGAKVMELQQRLPKARVVYCSATGVFVQCLQPTPACRDGLAVSLLSCLHVTSAS